MQLEYNFYPISIPELHLPYMKGYARRAWAATFVPIEFRNHIVKIDVCLAVYQDKSRTHDVFAEILVRGKNGEYEILDANLLKMMVKDTTFEDCLEVVGGRPRMVGLRFNRTFSHFGFEVCSLSRAFRFVTDNHALLAMAVNYGEKVRCREDAQKMVDNFLKISRFLGEMDENKHESRIQSMESSISWYKKQMADHDNKVACWHEAVRDSLAVLRKYGVRHCAAEV